jgi:hypothetical protein
MVGAPIGWQIGQVITHNHPQSTLATKRVVDKPKTIYVTIPAEVNAMQVIGTKQAPLNLPQIVPGTLIFGKNGALLVAVPVGKAWGPK